MDSSTRKEVVVGVAMLAAGLVYLVLTMNLKITRAGFVDAAFIPYVLAWFMCLLGALQLLMCSKRRPPPAAEEEAETAAVDYATVLKTLGLIVVYTALLDPLGFPLMTVLYLYAQFIVLTPAVEKVNHLRYLGIAVIASAAIFITFRHGFDLMLPGGFID